MIPLQQTYFHNLRLLKHCGSGAFGDVWLCQDMTGKVMALKTISKMRLGDSWKRELKGIANYRKITENSPFLIEIFHADEDEDYFFYTMECADSSAEDYVPDTLAGRLNTGPLPDEDIFPLLFSVFSGIETLHNAGLAHRDIKPDNILFTNGTAKLGDLGLIANVQSSATALAGTLDFIPPEIRSGDSISSGVKKYAQQNDLYAFGKVIYCTVTGQEPQNFPSIPVEMELSQTRKHYLRLSFRLCDRNPVTRLHDLHAVREEIFHIEEILQNGESFGERMISGIREIGRAVSLELMNAFPFSKTELPDPAKNKTQLYTHPGLKISMQIPADWNIITLESVRSRIQDIQNPDPEERQKLEMLRNLVQTGPSLIYCDHEKTFPDNCFIEKMQLKNEFEDLSDDLLAFQITELFKSDMGQDTKIFEVRKDFAADHFCICVEASLNPALFRSIFYLIFTEETCLSIALNCRNDSYPVRKTEFIRAIQSLHVGK